MINTDKTYTNYSDELELEITNALWIEYKFDEQNKAKEYEVAHFEGFTSKEYPRLFNVLKERKYNIELVKSKTTHDPVINFRVVSMEGENRDATNQIWNWHFVFNAKTNCFEYIDRVREMRVITPNPDNLIDYFLDDKRNMSKHFNFNYYSTVT